MDLPSHVSLRNVRVPIQTRCQRYQYLKQVAFRIPVAYRGRHTWCPFLGIARDAILHDFLKWGFVTLARSAIRTKYLVMTQNPNTQREGESGSGKVRVCASNI